MATMNRLTKYRQMDLKVALRYKYRKFRNYVNTKGIRNYKMVNHLVKNKYGIEIGGPSKIFNDIIKVYSVARQIDGCNFSTKTIWEGDLAAGQPYVYAKQKLGYQYINDATDLTGIEDDKYEFVLSSHCLEHVANPIKALKEWNRVLKLNGVIILVLPEPEHMFDNKRQLTTFQHILCDYENDVDESDLMHLQDVIENCNLSRVYVLHGKGETMSLETHVKISSDNPTLRAMHHHVYSDQVVFDMLKYSGFELLTNEHFSPFHMIYIAKKI